jgi:hypothetical protein
MHTPYQDSALDFLYNGLFCDDPSLLTSGATTAWARTLMAQPADVQALRALAAAPDTEARVAAMAYRRLQALGQRVPARELLGVVLEVPMQGGRQDTLAAFRDGSVRFIHNTGHSTIVEGRNALLQPTVERLLAASQVVVDRIGPSDKPRGAAPQVHVRLNFIVSDGLYFGEGPMQPLMNDGLAGPVLQAGIQLLNGVTSLVAQPA